jgi:hypothetical protein
LNATNVVSIASRRQILTAQSFVRFVQEIVIMTFLCTGEWLAILMTQKVSMPALERGKNRRRSMQKKEALELIDGLNRKIINPVEMLDWVTLRVIILQIPEEDWDAYMEEAAKILMLVLGI